MAGQASFYLRVVWVGHRGWNFRRLSSGKSFEVTRATRSILVGRRTVGACSLADSDGGLYLLGDADVYHAIRDGTLFREHSAAPVADVFGDRGDWIDLHRNV